jgi:hypothetical protein
MTTIAITDTHVAADSRSTDNDCVINWEGRKTFARAGRIFAHAGAAALLEPLAKWIEGGAAPAERPELGREDVGWTLIVIDREGVSLYTSEFPYPCKIKPPYTIGSGGPVAMGALLAGATAEQAARIACKVDVHSGEPIQVIDIQQALGLREPSLQVAKAAWPINGAQRG